MGRSSLWGQDWRPGEAARGTEPYCAAVGQPVAHQHLLGLSIHGVTSENRPRPNSAGLRSRLRLDGQGSYREKKVRT